MRCLLDDLRETILRLLHLTKGRRDCAQIEWRYRPSLDGLSQLKPVSPLVKDSRSRLVRGLSESKDTQDDGGGSDVRRGIRCSTIHRQAQSEVYCGSPQIASRRRTWQPHRARN